MPPRVVAASGAPEKSAMRRPTDVAAVIATSAARYMINSQAAAACKCTGGQRCTADRKDECKNDHHLTQDRPSFHGDLSDAPCKTTLLVLRLLPLDCGISAFL